MESRRDGSTPEAPYTAWLLIGIVGLLALALRLWGIAWGAPFIYHADEHYVLHRALDVVREHDLNPHWFQYPTLLIYVQALLILILQPFVYAPLTTNAALNGIGPWDALPEQWPFVLAGRLLVALAGVVGVVLLAQAGRRWHSAAAGVSAALLLAVLPLYVDSAHYLTTDVPAVVLIAATVWASLRAEPERMRAWVIAGACAGLAAGTKYTAGFVVLVPLVIASDLRQPSASLRRLMYVGAGVIAAFLIVCPYSLLDLENFLRGLDEQRQNYHAGSTPDHSWYWYLTYLWQYELHPGAAAAALVGVGFALHRRRRTDVALLFAPLCYFAVVATFPSRPERNVLPLLPFACLFAGRGIVEIGTRVLPARIASAVIAVVVLGLAWLPLGEAMRMNRERARPDTRTLAWQWVQTNLPAGTCVVREEYTPQLSAADYRVVYIWSLAQRPYSWYLGQGCDHVIASSHIYNRVYNPPFIGGATAAEFYRVLFTVPVVAEFTPGTDVTGPTIRIFKLPRE